MNERGKIIRTIAAVRPKMKIRTRVSDGEFGSEILPDSIFTEGNKENKDWCLPTNDAKTRESPPTFEAITARRSSCHVVDWFHSHQGRCHHENLAALNAFSERFTRAYAQRLAHRHDHLPPRRRFPDNLELDWQSRPTGSIIYLRRTSDAGMVKVLG
jgi:hypothetical protein